MKNRDYFIEALQFGAYKKLEWIIDAFSISTYQRVEQGAAEGLTYEQCYPYQLVKMHTDEESLYFADPNEKQFTKLSEYKTGEALLRFLDNITLQPNDLPNVFEPIETYYGNTLVNMYTIVYAFGGKIPFVTGTIKGSRIMDIVLPKLKHTNDPIRQTEQAEEYFYVDEFVKHCDAVSSLEGLILVAAPSITLETMMPTEGVLELRDKLLKQYADELDNPAVVVKIMNELVAYEKEHLKDPDTKGYYLKGKDFDVIRMKRFLLYGLEGGMGDKAPKLISSSLNEGWDMNSFPAMVDGARSGSYGRGKETAVGGEWVKHFQRVFQNVGIIEDDCGNNHGMTWLVTEYNHYRFVGLNRIIGNKIQMLDAETAKSLIGQTIEVRTPMLCHTKAPSFCAACCGKAISANREALHSVTSVVGSVFMNARMKKMHGRSAATKKYDITNSFS